MKKIVFSLGLLVLNIMAMEPEKIASFHDLPEELVLHTLTQPSELSDAISNIRKLLASDKKFQQKMNSTAFYDKVVKTLANTYKSTEDSIKFLLSLITDQKRAYASLTLEEMIKKALDIYPKILKDESALTAFIDILANKYNQMIIIVLNEFADSVYEKKFDKETNLAVISFLGKTIRNLVKKPSNFAAVVEENAQKYKQEPLYVAVQLYTLFVNAYFSLVELNRIFNNKYLNTPNKNKEIHNFLKKIIIQNPNNLLKLALAFGLGDWATAEKAIDDIAIALKRERWQLAIDLLIKLEQVPFTNYDQARNRVLRYVRKRPQVKIKVRKYIQQFPEKFKNPKDDIAELNNEFEINDLVAEYVNKLPETFKTPEQVLQWLNAE